LRIESKTIRFKENEKMDYFQIDTAAALNLRERPRAERLAAFEALGIRPRPGALHQYAEKMGFLNPSQSQKEQLLAEKRGVELIPLSDPRYPQGLRHIADAPFVISVRGNSQALLNLGPSVGIVGSRNADEEGCALAREFSAYLSSRGACIVSGLAYGVDGHAHAESLQCPSDIPSIAVLGQGLGTDVYPRAHRGLAGKILAAGGLIISQFALEENPLPGHFVNRNRVIAALSEAVLVIQAGEKSGALATARFAAEQGKDVLVLPGSSRDQRYVGSHRLIQQGAFLVTRPEEVVPHLSPLLPPVSQDIGTTEEVSAEAAKIHAVLCSQGPQDLDQLGRSLTLSPTQLLSALSELELLALIRRLPVNRASINSWPT
jgi:DNA processing protein